MQFSSVRWRVIKNWYAKLWWSSIFWRSAVCRYRALSTLLFAKVGHDMHVDLSLLPHIGTSALKTVPNSEKQSHRSLRKRMQTAGNSLQMKANVGWNYPGHDPKSGDLPFVVRKVTILCFPRGPQYQCWTCIQHTDFGQNM